MSSQTSSSSASIPLSDSQASCHDPFDSMVDFSEYDKLSYYSPSASPAANNKSQFTSRAVSNTPAALPSSSQPDLSGPSHNYAMYKQQTGIPQGAVASTLAINQMSQFGFNEGYVSGYPSDDLIDFGTAPAPNSTGFDDMAFDSSPTQEPGYVFPEVSPGFINPQTTLPVAAAIMPTQSSNVGRLWPGMHQQQAALAKAQAHQKQQQQAIHQQQRLNALGGPQKQRSRASTATEPFVEERISQLLESMRRGSVGSDDSNHDHHSSHPHRQRKEAEDMDEDERLLASEEGKKLSSKERRQLRNKVSARAFRSRRKEYIGQLEGEIAVKVNENAELLHDNRALRDEVTRLSDFTRMLLSSPCFSGFLDTLASNPAAAQTAQAVLQQPQPAPVEQQPLHQRKDVNPYAGQQQMDQQQHVGMTMIPEQRIDFSLFDNIGGFSYQPQVFSVLSLPETVIDADVLSGKSSPFTPLASDDKKVELPKIERMPVSAPSKIELPVDVDEGFDADPAFALFTATTIPPEIESAPTELDLSFLAHISSKPVQYELVVKTETNDASLRRVERLSRDVEACVARLMALTMHL